MKERKLIKNQFLSRLRTALAVTALIAFTWFFSLSPTLEAAATLVVDDDLVECPGAGYTTIQAAVNAAVSGDTVEVCDGTYTENVIIDKTLILRSLNGRAVTTIQGISSVGALGSVKINSGVGNVQIGATGQGFTIIGIDNGAPGVENAALYFQGSHNGAQVIDNEVVADGEAGLLSEFGGTNSGFVIDGNLFSGQTFLGPNPAGNGFGQQFTLPNVPRQCVTISGGSGGGNTSNVTFTNNDVTCTAGGLNGSGDQQGNTLVTIDSNGGTISGNLFAGKTARFATSLRARGPVTMISGNTFDSSDLMPPATGHVFIQNTGEALSTVASNNTFDKGVYIDGAVGTIGIVVEPFVENAPAGSTVNVLPGTYVESGQIVVSADVNLVGADRSSVTIQPGFDTGSSGDSRGFFLVNPGVTFNISDLTIDGTGQKVWQAIRHKGQGTVTNVDFREIRFQTSGSPYAGTAIAAFGGLFSAAANVDVINSTFAEIGRIGVQYFGAGTTGTYTDNTYAGKGVGDWLDYGVEVGAGAVATIDGSQISGNRGVAATDGSTSAGVLVTTFFGGGSEATITNNEFTDNTTAIAVGFDSTDTSTVNAEQNNITGNDNGVTSTNPPVEAACNWWDDPSGPSGAGPGSGDSVDPEVSFVPWLLNPAPSTCLPFLQLDKQEVRDDIANLLPTGNSKVDKAIEKALESLDDSLAPELWLDPAHPDPKDGHKVFNEEKKAVKDLEKAIKEGGPVPALQDAIDSLVGIDRNLATIAIDEVDCGAAIDDKAEEKCQKELAKALEELAKGDAADADAQTEGKDFEKAIDHYKKAWEHALKALGKQTGSEIESAAIDASTFSEEIFLPVVGQ